MTEPEMMQILAVMERRVVAAEEKSKVLGEHLCKLTAQVLSLEVGLGLRPNLNIDQPPGFMPQMSMAALNVFEQNTRKKLGL